MIDEREAIALGADQSEDGLVGDGPEKGIGELEEEAGHEMEVAFGVLEPEPESHYLSRLARVAVEIEDEAGEEAAVDGVEHVELFLSHRDGVRGSGEERRRRRRHWKCDGGGGKEGGEGFVGVSWDAIRDVWRRRAWLTVWEWNGATVTEMEEIIWILGDARQMLSFLGYLLSVECKSLFIYLFFKRQQLETFAWSRVRFETASWVGFELCRWFANFGGKAVWTVLWLGPLLFGKIEKIKKKNLWNSNKIYVQKLWKYLFKYFSAIIFIILKILLMLFIKV